MMSIYLSVSLRAQIAGVDRGRCCYCQTSEANSGLAMTHDHILPRALGGGNSFENVCLACHRCNECKSDRLNATDPLSGQDVQLFHPRQQVWAEHFRWSPDGTRVEGLTIVGRSTVEALRMNHPVIVVARSRWVMSGWHPPD
jgi:HNH endonuclease